MIKISCIYLTFSCQRWLFFSIPYIFNYLRQRIFFSRKSGLQFYLPSSFHTTSNNSSQFCDWMLRRQFFSDLEIRLCRCTFDSTVKQMFIITSLSPKEKWWRQWISVEQISRYGYPEIGTDKVDLVFVVVINVGQRIIYSVECTLDGWCVTNIDKDSKKI